MIDSKRENGLLKQTNIVIPYRFFLITFLWSWGLWISIPIILPIFPIPEKLQTVITFVLLILGAFGPLYGAISCLRREGCSIKNFFRQSLDLNLGWRAYVLPVIIFGGSTFIAWFVPEIYEERRLSILLPTIWVFIPCLFFMMVFGGGQEEFGWRGYLLPILEKRYGIWIANVFLGVIWACWHIPLWFIVGTSQRFMNFFGFIILSIGYSFILSWIRNIARNKIFSGIYSHGLANALIPVMPTIVMQENAPQPRFWIWVFLTFAIGAVITLFRINKTDAYA